MSNTQANGRTATLNAFEVCTEFATLASTVYGTASGGDNQRVEHFVQEFYYGALQREPTSAEMLQQTQRLNNAAALGQSQVVAEAQAMGRDIFQATNYNSNHTDQEYVTDLYEAFLQRAPDGPGLNFWVNNTQANGRAATLTAFQVSTEYPELAGTLYRETFWLVGDHLGTPRMVVNKSGSLAGIKRHDYLPFGEELQAGTGGRIWGQGYTGDSVRQKFTLKERDIETGLDYSINRYYSSTQGRFTSPDPMMASAKLSNPQTMNRYVYVINNPLRYIDPDGLDGEDPWSNLTRKEQLLLAPKLTTVQDGYVPNQKQLAAAGEAFNLESPSQNLILIPCPASLEISRPTAAMTAAACRSLAPFNPAPHVLNAFYKSSWALSVSPPCG